MKPGKDEAQSSFERLGAQYIVEGARPLYDSVYTSLPLWRSLRMLCPLLCLNMVAPSALGTF